MAMPIKDISGERFGRLQVVRLSEARVNRKAAWVCVCDCGGMAVVVGTKLRGGEVRSCGCLAADVSAQSMKKMATTHGLKGTPEYRAYHDMINRCYKPRTKQFKDYGGRGITVCDRWLEPDGQGVVNFVNDMGKRPKGLSLDRIDNDAGYSPENCRWATKSRQGYNRRKDARNTSGRTGVAWIESKGKWKAYIKRHRRMINLGYHDSFEAACAARESAELEIYGVAKE